jgi:hypothetical protein
MAHTARAVGVPAALAALPLGTFRPQQAQGVYAHPRPELARLVKLRALHRLAPGHFTVVPQEYVGTDWMPSLEAAAAGIAAANFGGRAAVLMGVSAARLHGAIARAVSVAYVAAPRQHALLRLSDRQAVVRFVKRDTQRLDVELLPTDLGPVPVTTVEQTALDLVRLKATDVDPAEIATAVRALVARSDPGVLEALAENQHLRAALRRARAQVSA